MDIKKEQLKEQGFTQDQIDEIQKGLEAGIDVSLYAKKEFLAIQMRQIRYGLQQGLNIEKYVSLEYDWFQMEEIRKGLLGGIKVELYAFPDVSYDRMKQIRLGLCEGIDLSPYKKIDAGILKELREAMQNRINIVPYINAGYDAEQLAVIRTALKKNLKLDDYLDKAFRGISLQEICIGLEHGIDVSVYAKIEYAWQQMRELRLGLEHLIAIEEYSNAYYSWQQMREIRLGLEEGLDVSYYRSFLYTAYEMRKRRLALQENPLIALVNIKHPMPETDAGKHYQISVSANEMEVYAELKGSTDQFSRTELLKVLRDMGITYGIQFDEIEKAASDHSFRRPILVARGLPAKDGKDGWYEFFFRTDVAPTPKEMENGSVDYQNVEWFEMVEKGQKLAYYHSATQGENGITVTGEEVHARKGREQSILTGSGFTRLSDGKTYVSDMQGIVTIHKFHLEVSKLLVVDAVNLASGNVSFDGNVYIKGNVGNGTRIELTGDLVVQGFVEASEIICGGNVLLQKGMNASGNGFVHAGKDVLGQFFEATEIDAGGSVQSDYFLNCKIHAQEQVYAIGKKGILAGGSVFAEKGLRTGNLGNHAGLITHVKIGVMGRIMEKEKKLNDEIKFVNDELRTLENAHRDFQRKYTAEIRNTMKIYLKIESAIYTIEKQKEEILQKKAKLAEEKKKAITVSAVIDNHLYDGVSLEVDGLRWTSKYLKHVTVKKMQNRIAVFSN